MRNLPDARDDPSAAGRAVTSFDRSRPEVNNVLVLAYHAVSEDWAAALSVTPNNLELQLQTLARSGYRGATFTDAVLTPHEERTVILTFDDSYRSVLELALPILSGHGFPGTVFVPTAFAGSRSPMAWPGIDRWLGGRHEAELAPMSWDDLGVLAEAGWEIGSHTHTHPRLTALDDQSLIEELTESRRQCEQRLGQPCSSLCYPYGDHDSRVVDAAAKAGYAAACTLPRRLHPSEPLRWPRIGVYHGDGRARFRLKISPSLRRLRASRIWPAA